MKSKAEVAALMRKLHERVTHADYMLNHPNVISEVHPKFRRIYYALERDKAQQQLDILQEVFGVVVPEGLPLTQEESEALAQDIAEWYATNPGETS